MKYTVRYVQKYLHKFFQVTILRIDWLVLIQSDFRLYYSGSNGVIRDLQ